MRVKRRNISWLSISSSAFLPNKMLDKCNFTAHAWCEHTVTMFGINKKKVIWERSRKCFGSLQFSCCSHSLCRYQWNRSWISQKSKDALWLLLKAQQTGSLFRLQHRCSQYKICRSNCLVLPLLQPQQAAQDQPAGSLLSSTSCPWSH